MLMENRSKEKASPEGRGRRKFLTKLWFALGFVALAEFVAVAFVFFRPDKSQKRQDDGDTLIAAGSVNSFAPESVTAYVRGRFYLVRLADGGFLALSRKCTHLGCTVPWVEQDQIFACPCHASAFDITGSVVSPPAPRAMDAYPVSIENEIVKIDIGKPIERSEFHKEQVTYPKKTLTG